MFVGSIVMRVNATDADDPTTQNGMIEYRLLNGTDLFNINHEGVYLNYIHTLYHSTLGPVGFCKGFK